MLISEQNVQVCDATKADQDWDDDKNPSGITSGIAMPAIG